MTHDDQRMTGGELQTVRDYLGLTTESLAGILDVRHDTVRRWESGRDPIPYRVRDEVEQIEAYTAAAVTDLVSALSDAPDPAVVVYRTDADMHADRPDTKHLPARWWRHVVARAAHEIPGVAIGTRNELAQADPDRLAAELADDRATQLAAIDEIEAQRKALGQDQDRHRFTEDDVRRIVEAKAARRKPHPQS